MTKDTLTFYNYLCNYKTDLCNYNTDLCNYNTHLCKGDIDNLDIILFKNIFDIEKLPDKITSSKKIMKILDIKSDSHFRIFKNIYNNYFKTLLQRN